MPLTEPLMAMRRAAPTVLPSMLLCDFSNLEREIGKLEEGEVAGLHLDVMDGQFVPNFTYGMPIVEGMRRLTDLPLDVHLMIQNPLRYIDAFCAAGADVLTVHAEATDNLAEVIQAIHHHGIAAGVALNPETPVATIAPLLDQIDLVLVMSVQAGFGGQAFQETVLDKLATVRELTGDRVVLEIDGGVNLQTIGACHRAGAELLVAGSAVFGSHDYSEAINQLRQAAQLTG